MISPAPAAGFADSENRVPLQQPFCIGRQSNLSQSGIRPNDESMTKF